MNRILKRLAIAVAVLLVLSIAGLAWMLQQHPSLQPYAALQWKRESATAATLRVSFLGVATVLLDDGETTILTIASFRGRTACKPFCAQWNPIWTASRAVLRAQALR